MINHINNEFNLNEQLGLVDDNFNFHFIDVVHSFHDNDDVVVAVFTH